MTLQWIRWIGYAFNCPWSLLLVLISLNAYYFIAFPKVMILNITFAIWRNPSLEVPIPLYCLVTMTYGQSNSGLQGLLKS